jgi:hypothetical protein
MLSDASSDYTVYAPWQNLYIVLGVSPNATELEIERAVRKELLRWHTDKCPSRELMVAYEEVTMTIFAAWRVLCDPEERRRYDESQAPVWELAADDRYVRTMLAKVVVDGILKRHGVDWFMRVGSVAAYSSTAMFREDVRVRAIVAMTVMVLKRDEIALEMTKLHSEERMAVAHAMLALLQADESHVA